MKFLCFAIIAFFVICVEQQAEVKIPWYFNWFVGALIWWLLDDAGEE